MICFKCIRRAPRLKGETDRVCYLETMRYLVKGRVKPGREKALIKAIENGTLGKRSVAGDEYLHNMNEARATEDGTAHWVEVCFCATPLAEERPYWEEYFELVSVKDAHGRKNCRDLSGTERFVCSLRTARNSSGIPLVLMSGCPERHDLALSGANFYFEKPISVEAAVRTLSAARNLIVNGRLRYHREPVNVPVSISFAGQTQMSVHLMNLSQGGIGICQNVARQPE